jgi:DeoR/GlpR family transcriptional regulator of sugar metabolism
MLTAERRRYILEILGRDGKVLIPELSTDLGVSEDTVRRDLRDLAGEGLLQRVHGGALPRSPSTANYAARQQQAPDAKARIARAAAGLITNDQVVLLDGGTTALQVAQHLPRELRGTIITPSPPIAVALAEHPNVEVVILGGRLYKHALVSVGAATLDSLRMVRADLCMLGVGGLHPELGVSTDDLEEAHVKRAMIDSAAEVVALTSAEKINTASPYIVGPLSQLDYIVTESEVPDHLLRPYENAGIAVIRA